MRQSVCAILIIPFVTNIWAHIHQHQNSFQVSPLTTALRIGKNSNGVILYLCIGELFHSQQPGKTWAGYAYCNIGHGGKEYVVSKFTVPNQQQFGYFIWVHKLQGTIEVGRDTNGTPLFLCQSDFQGGIQPGRTWPGYNHCNITYRGREIISDDYRVLSNRDELTIHSKPSTHLYNKSKQIHY